MVKGQAFSSEMGPGPYLLMRDGTGWNSSGDGVKATKEGMSSTSRVEKMFMKA